MKKRTGDKPKTQQFASIESLVCALVATEDKVDLPARRPILLVFIPKGFSSVYRLRVLLLPSGLYVWVSQLIGYHVVRFQ